ncbi:HAMP domain-containing histidine kinase [Blautia schinkii]|nr:HAMP domain-containing histidine kinase [Blautia schinkii]
MVIKLKSKTQNREKYTSLKSKIFLQGMGIMAVAFVVILIGYKWLWQGSGGDWVVYFLQNALHMDWEIANNIYGRLFRNNESLIWIGATLIVFMILFRFFLSGLTRYFDEVSRGIDLLLSDNEEEIILPPEMSAIETKLNTMRRTLERRELEARMAEQRKNDLVVYLAHDIRTPLTSVIGYLSLLDELPDMPMEQRARYVHITLDKAKRLDLLINEFFEITRYNLQEITLEKETIDLYYMLVQIVDEFYPILETHGNTAKLVADENLTIFADPVKLARVFNNILKNAIAYSYQGSEIVISAESTEKEVLIYIRNRGKTIPEKKLESIFEKFYRLDDSRTSNTGGAGLGLAIAKEIVTLHGGTITAQSKDELTTFCVSLPVA